MSGISVVQKTKEYIVIKIPRRVWGKLDMEAKEFSERNALKVLRAGVKEWSEKKTKHLRSLRELRHGN